MLIVLDELGADGSCGMLVPSFYFDVSSSLMIDGVIFLIKLARADVLLKKTCLLRVTSPSLISCLLTIIACYECWLVILSSTKPVASIAYDFSMSGII